jgi:hypothetical protein
MDLLLSICNLLFEQLKFINVTNLSSLVLQKCDVIRYRSATLLLYLQYHIFHVVHTGSVVHPTSYPMGTGGSFPGVKRQGRETDHSPPVTAEVKKIWIYTSTLPYAFMV